MRNWAMPLALAMAATAFVSVSSAPVKANADSIEAVMQLTHNIKTGLREKIADEAGKDKPDWDAIQKNSKKLVAEISKLPKLDPPNGGKDSWAKLTKDYIALVKLFETAAEKKDAKGIKAAYEKTEAACKACHDEHR